MYKLSMSQMKFKFKNNSGASSSIRRRRMILNLVLESVTDSANKYKRYHWAIKNREVNKWTLLLLKCFGENNKFPIVPLKRAEVSICQYRHRLLDPDNLYGSCKILLDCMTPPNLRKRYGLGIIASDSAYNLNLSVGQIRIQKTYPQKTEIEIREV